MTHIISCAQYDYFEIACMHHYKVELTLNNGDVVIGKAHNVKVVKDGDVRKEVLDLALINNQIINIELMTIHKMRAITDNLHFKVIQLDKNNSYN